ncbi:MAG: hypothetical protein ACL93V_11530 [Candidatus Electrothrix sp. YB6]
MPPRKKTTSAAKKPPVRYFSFRLSPSGIAGIAVVTFCLFLWMFLIGLWAGQSLLPPDQTAVSQENSRVPPPAPPLPQESTSAVYSVQPPVPSPHDLPVKVLTPQSRKQHISRENSLDRLL